MVCNFWEVSLKEVRYPLSSVFSFLLAGTQITQMKLAISGHEVEKHV